VAEKGFVDYSLEDISPEDFFYRALRRLTSFHKLLLIIADKARVTTPYYLRSIWLSYHNNRKHIY